MRYVASQAPPGPRPRAIMRPRRWYTDEIPPTRRKAVKLNSTLWRYRSFMYRTTNGAAPVVGAASLFYPQGLRLFAKGRRVPAAVRPLQIFSVSLAFGGMNVCISFAGALHKITKKPPQNNRCKTIPYQVRSYPL